MSNNIKTIRTFVLLSLIIGIFLSIIQTLGYFSKFDNLFYGLDSSTQNLDLLNPDGILSILIFAIIPGIPIILWGNEKGFLCAVGCLIAYYGGAWVYWKYASRMLPLAAPAAATLLSIVRALGWRPVLAVAPSEAVSPSKHPSPLSGNEYDAFISYRREGGSETARLIRSELLRRGVKSFLDVVDLGASHFDDRLLQAIEKAPAFILILSSGSLDQCHRPGDWLRREISHAISRDKNIIPILKEGFVFPEKETLPADMAELPRYNCVPYSHAYFEAATERVMGFLAEQGLSS